jgi:hypothetical protein
MGAIADIRPGDQVLDLGAVAASVEGATPGRPVARMSAIADIRLATLRARAVGRGARPRVAWTGKLHIMQLLGLCPL